MDRIADRTLIVLCCFAVLLLMAPAAITGVSVASLLLAIIVAALSELPWAPRWLRRGCALLYLCAALFVPTAAAFIALVIYDFVRARSWTLRLAWIPLATVACRALPAGAIGALALACVISALLARKTLRLDSEAVAHRAQSDELRGWLLALEEKNRALKEKQDYELQLATLGERARIAREIHDNVGHLLTRSALQIEALRVVRAHDRALDGELRGLSATINEALDAVRESVHDLHSESFDLEIRLRALTKEEHAFSIALDYQVDQAPASIGYSLVAIAREALTNIDRHSDASRVTLSVYEYPAFFQLTVADNGTRDPFAGEGALREPRRTARPGFAGSGRQSAEAGASGGIGLKTMEERVRDLGGVFRVEYSGGVRVFASIPKAAVQASPQAAGQAGLAKRAASQEAAQDLTDRSQA